MTRPFRLAASVAAVVASAAVAHADVITVSGTGSRGGTGSFSVPVTLTPAQVSSLTAPGVTLNSITISGNAFASGTHGFENLDAVSQTISLTHNVNVGLNLPGGGSFIPTTNLDLRTPPGASITLPAFDNTDDRGGTSGATFTGLSATGSTVSNTLTGASAASLLGSFLPGGTATFGGTTLNSASASGSGNIDALFITNGGANVSLTFNFTPAQVNTAATPEPASMAVFGGLLLGGLGYARRKLFA